MNQPLVLPACSILHPCPYDPSQILSLSLSCTSPLSPNKDQEDDLQNSHNDLSNNSSTYPSTYPSTFSSHSSSKHNPDSSNHATIPPIATLETSLSRITNEPTADLKIPLTTEEVLCLSTPPSTTVGTCNPVLSHSPYCTSTIFNKAHKVGPEGRYDLKWQANSKVRQDGDEKKDSSPPSSPSSSPS
eukprot:CAMPEP_0118652470 /NCGR_PEP_ID=MMETSP0785-20121206/11336_1 /TAXON_ID=91992 /ORGANISM="Bolidomonas pacifica, Strain CCMP 1866" /LENGTH=186 /DNA_ID=CAMNT_0006544991 /DNA_START=108 /DNA_END=665 /DNA_ORIENTATION=-